MVPTFTTNRSTREVPSYTPTASPRVRRRPSSWPPHRPICSGFGVTRPVSTAGAHGVPTPIHQGRGGSTLTVKDGVKMSRVAPLENQQPGLLFFLIVAGFGAGFS